MPFSRVFRRAGQFIAASTLSFLALCAVVPAASAAPTTGEMKTAVILVNFTDNTAQPKSAADSHALVFGQVSDFLWEASYQKTFLSGDTFGWFTITASSTLCDTATIVREGNAAATAAGADLSRYNQFIYMFPFRSGCSWSGTGAVGPAGEKIVYINGTGGFGLQTIAHEIGHGFGLGHSDGYDCDISPLGNTCTQQGYADPADTMGNRAAHFNAFQKERLGWLNAAGAPPITTVTASGRYRIEPYETAGTGAKALKVLKSTDPTSGQKTWYYLESRQAIGFDAILAGRGTITSGLQLRTGTVSSSGTGTSLLLDTTPNTINTSKSSDFEDGVIAVGSSYVDSVAGVTITLVSLDASGAVVDVTVGTAPTAPVSCVRNVPVISLAGTQDAVAAGSTVTYTVSLTNRDSSGCTATTFNLARSVPAGWEGTLGAASLSLSPGASVTTTLVVKSATSAAAGDYGVGVGMGSAVGTVHTASASTVYKVSAPIAGALEGSVGTDRTSYLRGQTVYMSARVVKSGVSVAGASVEFVITLPGGATVLLKATTGADGYARATYKVGKSKSAVGAYALKANASLSGSSTSASTGFSVT